ncbi:hypothetical protein N7509_012181 [Penicillium cosmopolitanum]|uniref:UBL3-like ubiquitin domain-containing protein n=1 Tax=Penicillium cosmopolitanum TaxID=1131564 RepID=A0A9W9VEI4_9EURO|nr:uncharacterized protein N7509_012181 [Penicillium cosmopolitanum]KAJ5379062.1 hypothetical protein N7509_012181 [Penicillium cosmopolitanum]
MSSSDHPESGVPGATTSPQHVELQPTATAINEPPSAPTSADPPVAGSEVETEATTSVAPAKDAQSGAAVDENHPASGGDSLVAPMTATTTTTTTPVNDNQTPLRGCFRKEMEDTGPSLHITLLLTTGSRHPFTIDGKYLKKRAITVENNDPFAISVYTLKELIWREWRSDWETRPSSPSSIRLISFGKLLDDKSPLSDSKFNHDAPNVVHMTVKPQEVVDEEDAKGAKAQYSREREASERSPGCRCVIL